MHRLFHSLVVCGAGLSALQCSADAKSDPDGLTPPSAGTAPTSGAGGDGELTISVGGSGTSAGGAPGLPESGPRQQWSCAVLGDCQQVSDTSGFALTDCVVDSTRPASAADCEADKIFACATGILPDGTATPFNCECAPPPGEGESCPCPALGPRCLDVPPNACSDAVSTCSCAMTCIVAK